MLWSVIVKRNNRKLAFDKKEIFQRMDQGDFAVMYVSYTPQSRDQILVVI